MAVLFSAPTTGSRCSFLVYGSRFVPYSVIHKRNISPSSLPEGNALLIINLTYRPSACSNTRCTCVYTHAPLPIDEHIIVIHVTSLHETHYVNAPCMTVNTLRVLTTYSCVEFLGCQFSQYSSKHCRVTDILYKARIGRTHILWQNIRPHAMLTVRPLSLIHIQMCIRDRL